MLSRCPYAAYRFEYLLDQEVLVGNKGVVINEGDVIAKIGQLCCSARIKGELVFEDVTFLAVDCT